MREGGVNKNFGLKGVQAMCRSHEGWGYPQSVWEKTGSKSLDIVK